MTHKDPDPSPDTAQRRPDGPPLSDAAQPTLSESEKALEIIKTMIIERKIKPEQLISERALAAHIGLGRTPVREAMRELAHLDLLEVVPMRGSFLRRLTVDEVREIYEVRLAIESMAAYLVSQRPFPHELKRLKEQMTAYIDKDDQQSIEEMTKLGWDLHSTIVAATGNRRLLKTYEALNLPITVSRSLNPTSADRALSTLQEHLAILDAVESGDGQRAQSLISNHLSSVLRDRVRLQHVHISPYEG